MPNVKHLAIGKISVVDGHHHVAVALGLPFAAAFIDGDVVGGQSLLAVGVIALHRGRLHRGVGGHHAPHGEIHRRAIGPAQGSGHRHRSGGGLRVTRAWCRSTVIAIGGYESPRMVRRVKSEQAVLCLGFEGETCHQGEQNTKCKSETLSQILS